MCAGEGFQAIFKDLLVDQVIEGGQTMNPSADDIAQACKKINAENIIILPNNKNIILSAEQSRMLVPNRNIFVLQTKDIPQGLDKGQLVTTGSDVEAVTTNLIDSMLTEDKEVVTLYYGIDVKEEDAEAYVEKLAETHPDVEFILHYGGQPLYYYVLSVE